MNANLKVTDRSERELAEAGFNERISGGTPWRTPLLKWIVPAVLATILCTLQRLDEPMVCPTVTCEEDGDEGDRDRHWCPFGINPPQN